ncbi:MAG: hypothetical protein QGH25_18400, partial [Candidatus Latescibacteria bacterium]|nr:hypothetical protein [Candidatus Latescibacterota bacterium]
MTIATHDPPKIPGRRVRIERLKTQIMARKGSFVEDVNPFLRSVALWRASQGERSRIQVRAAYLRELVKLAPLVIGEDWSLAGNHLPTAHIGLNRPDCENPEHVQQLRALGILPEQVKGVLDAVEQWDTGRTCAIGETDPAYQLGLGRVNREDSRIVFWASGHIENHSIRDYAKVLKMGFAGIREEVEKLL